MRRIIFIILLSIISMSTYAGKPIVKTTPDGTIIYINQLKASPEKPTKGTDMEYEFTLVSTSDSVRVTATLITSGTVSIDSVAVIMDDRRFSYPVEKIYVEPAKGKWENRLCFYMSYGDFEKYVGARQPIYRWFGGDTLSYSTRANKRKKEVEQLSLALVIVEQNKK